MARTATKKKTSKKKTSKKSATDDLEAEIEADLAEEFDFKEPKKGKAAAKGKAVAKGSLVGKTVTFINDDKKEITGKVTEQDGDNLVVENDAAFWECLVEDLVDQTAATKSASKKKASKSKGKSKVEEPEEEEEEASAMREIDISKIKVPKVKAREHNPESEKWKRMCADIKRRKRIRVPLEVTSFDAPVLTDGNRRLEAAKALGWDTVPCIEYDAGGTTDDQLWNALLSNEMREEMHWTQLATAFAKLIKGGEYTQGKIARAFGISQSDVSRMVSGLKLPKAILAQAQAQAGGGSGNEKGTTYSDGVYYELAAAEKPIQKWAQEIMAEGGKLTQDDLRQKKKTAKADKEAKGEKVDGRGSKKGDGGTSTPTRASLSSKDVGDYLKVSVLGEHIEIKAHIPWKKASMKGFNPVEEIKELFACVFADEEVVLDSFPALAKAIQDAKKGLS